MAERTASDETDDRRFLILVSASIAGMIPIQLISRCVRTLPSCL